LPVRTVGYAGESGAKRRAAVDAEREDSDQ
jgi:hypothetical protein